MKEELNIKHANIDNLTSLWQTASMPYRSYFSESKFSYSFINNFNWPNRLWLKQDVNQETNNSIKDKIKSISVQLIVTYFDIYKTNLYKDLDQHGFTKPFEQVGMSLKIGKLQQI